MRTQVRTVVAFIALLFIATPVLAGQAAQAKPADPPPELTEEQRIKLGQRLTLRGVVLAGVADPSLRGGVGAPKPEVILVVQNDGKAAAKARMGLIRGNFMADVTLTGPVLTGDSTAELFTHEGVGSNTSVRIRAQYVHWKPATDTELAIIIEKAEKSIRTTDTSPGATVRAAEEAIDKKLRDGVKTGHPVFLSASYEFGSQTFKFIDPVTLVDQKRTESPWAANVSFGVLTREKKGLRAADSPGVYFGGSVEFFESFKATPQRQICRPFGAGGFECDKFSVGPPTRKSGQSVQFESRLWLNSARVGLNPRVIYDVQDKYWTLEIPVYFLKLTTAADKLLFSKVPDLAGGVTAGWRSDQDQGWYAVLFIGPTFKLPSPPAK